MEKRSSHFEDHLSVVEAGQEKTASAKHIGGGLLEKLARELNLPSDESEKTASDSITAPAAPAAEGEVHPADSSVAGASAAVVSATEAVATPQTTIAGGNPAEAAAGEMPGATKPNEGVAISAGDGKVTDANNLHRTPEAVEAAAEDAGGDESVASVVAPEKAGEMPENEKMAEAKNIGKMIAKSFQETLAKEAEARDYAEAVGILKEAGLLEGYKLKDEGMDKTASYKQGGLEKIANRQPLSRSEIIGAAIEYVEMEKEAEAAEEAGRQDARDLVEFVKGIQKEASFNSDSEEVESEKIASLLKKPEVVQAVQVLRKNQVI